MADEKNDEQEPKTRTRSTQSAKADQTEQEQSAVEKRKAEAAERAEAKKAKDAEVRAQREEKRKEQEAKRAEEKEAREAKKKEDAEKKEREKAEKAEAKEREKAEKRQALIESGQIIFANRDGDKLNAEDANEDDGELVTYARTEPKKEVVADRARSVIQDLIEGATEVPMPGKDLSDAYGGGTVQWVSFFGMLRVLGYVEPYRYRTGVRGVGEGGLAYLWVGPTDLELVESKLNGDAPSEDEADQVAEEAAEEVAA